MRTTVNLDDALLSKARVVAAQRRRPLGSVLDDALRIFFAQRERLPRRRVTLPTDGGSGLQPGVDLEDKEALARLLGDDELPRATS